MIHRTETDDGRTRTASALDEAHRWDRRVDRLLAAFDESDEAPARLRSKMEALRHKRDSVVTKAHALFGGGSAASSEYRNARRELRETWRSIIKTLDRESMLL